MIVRDFLNMSGYGGYVWSCYGLALVVLVSNVWAARRQLREQIVHARRRLQIQQEAPP
ncbi:MAG: heme exporter protein CcmD [Steroidobacter sp.]